MKDIGCLECIALWKEVLTLPPTLTLTPALTQTLTQALTQTLTQALAQTLPLTLPLGRPLRPMVPAVPTCTYACGAGAR